MDLTQIRYFLTLARTLNFTRAAELCNVTQPALTKSIRRLEDEFGGALLARERNHTHLTDLGIAMLPLLQQTYDAAETARKSALRLRQTGIARLRLGLGHWLEPMLVMPLIQQVAQRFSDVEITVRQGDITALNAWLLASEIDVTLTADIERLTERAKSWPIFDDPIVALLPDAHPRAATSTLPAESLLFEAIIGRMDPDTTDGVADQPLEARLRVTPAVRHRGATDEQVHALVQVGIGVALSTSRRRVPPGVVRVGVEPPCTLAFFVAAIAGRPMSRAADAFLRLARARDWEDGYCRPMPRSAA